jgi:hypothetical protein
MTRRELFAEMAAAHTAAFILGRGDAMHGTANIQILFLAGFGPIVREATSHKLYRDVLGIPFKEEADGYLHTEALRGAKSFALWPLSQAAHSVLAKIPGLTIFPHHKRGVSSTLTTSKRQRRSLNREDIECSSRTRKNHGGKPLVVSSHRRGYWSV